MLQTAIVILEKGEYHYDIKNIPFLYRFLHLLQYGLLVLTKRYPDFTYK